MTLPLRRPDRDRRGTALVVVFMVITLLTGALLSLFSATRSGWQAADFSRERQQALVGLDDVLERAVSEVQHNLGGDADLLFADFIDEDGDLLLADGDYTGWFGNMAGDTDETLSVFFTATGEITTDGATDAAYEVQVRSAYRLWRNDDADLVVDDTLEPVDALALPRVLNEDRISLTKPLFDYYEFTLSNRPLVDNRRAASNGTANTPIRRIQAIYRIEKPYFPSASYLFEGATVDIDNYRSYIDGRDHRNVDITETHFVVPFSSHVELADVPVGRAGHDHSLYYVDPVSGDPIKIFDSSQQLWRNQGLRDQVLGEFLTNLDGSPVLFGKDAPLDFYIYNKNNREIHHLFGHHYYNPGHQNHNKHFGYAWDIGLTVTAEAYNDTAKPLLGEALYNYLNEQRPDLAGRITNVNAFKADPLNGDRTLGLNEDFNRNGTLENEDDVDGNGLVNYYRSSVNQGWLQVTGDREDGNRNGIREDYDRRLAEVGQDFLIAVTNGDPAVAERDDVQAYYAAVDPNYDPQGGQTTEDYQQDVTDAQEAIDEQNQQIDEVSAAVQETEAQIAAAQEQIDAAEAELIENQDSIDDAEDQIPDLEREISQTEGRIPREQNKVNNAENTITSEQNKITRWEGEIASREQQIADLSPPSNRNERRAVNRLNNQIRSRERNISRAQDKIAREEGKRDAAQELIDGYNETIAGFEAVITALETEISQLESANQTLQASIDGLQETISNLETLRDEQQIQLQGLQEGLDNLGDSLNTAENNLANPEAAALPDITESLNLYMGFEDLKGSDRGNDWDFDDVLIELALDPSGNASYDDPDPPSFRLDVGIPAIISADETTTYFTVVERVNDEQVRTAYEKDELGNLVGVDGVDAFSADDKPVEALIEGFLLSPFRQDVTDLDDLLTTIGTANENDGQDANVTVVRNAGGQPAVLDGNVQGEGVLIVEGDLEIYDNVVWRGSIIVNGKMTMNGSEFGRGAWVFGSVLVRGEGVSGDALVLKGKSVIAYSSEDLQRTRALVPNLRPLAVPVAWRTLR